jgi:hypothetical protein
MGLSFNLLPQVPLDHELRALAQMGFPEEYLNAREILSWYDSFFEGWFTPGLYLDPKPLYRGLISQGGYAPTANRATPEDQLFMIFAGILALRHLLPSDTHSRFLARFNDMALAWQDSRLRDPTTPGFGEWVRDAGAASWL